VGSKKNAIWRVVVADRRSPRDGRFIEMIGHYNPQTEPSQIVIDKERLQHWLDRGAQPSNTVRKLMRAETSAAPAGAAVADQPPPDAAEEPVPEGVAAPDAEAPDATTEAAAAEEEPAAGQPAEEAEGATADAPAPEADGDAESG
jgi:small subunit ribosomal protein S16